MSINLFIISVGLSILAFFLWGSPYKRGFFCDDESLKHPFHDSTVKSWMLYMTGMVLPIALVSLIFFSFFSLNFTFFFEIYFFSSKFLFFSNFTYFSHQISSLYLNCIQPFIAAAWKFKKNAWRHFNQNDQWSGNASQCVCVCVDLNCVRMFFCLYILSTNRRMPNEALH